LAAMRDIPKTPIDPCSHRQPPAHLHRQGPASASILELPLGVSRVHPIWPAAYIPHTTRASNTDAESLSRISGLDERQSPLSGSEALLRHLAALLLRTIKWSCPICRNLERNLVALGNDWPSASSLASGFQCSLSPQWQKSSLIPGFRGSSQRSGLGLWRLPNRGPENDAMIDAVGPSHVKKVVGVSRVGPIVARHRRPNLCGKSPRNIVTLLYFQRAGDQPGEPGQSQQTALRLGRF
jgi:hypothetical protein